MKDGGSLINIKILDREYSIKCTAEDAKELRETAHYLDSQMRKMRQSSHRNNTDRIAVILALNLCHELRALKKQKANHSSNADQNIQQLTSRIQHFLAHEEEITV